MRIACALPIPSLFGLAPCGVCHAPRITERAVRSYRTFSPLPRPKPRRYILCGTFRLTDLNPQSRTLSGTLLFEVRTFLSPLRAAQNIWRSQRDSDHPIQHQLNTIIRRRGMNFSYHPATTDSPTTDLREHELKNPTSVVSAPFFSAPAL